MIRDFGFFTLGAMAAASVFVALIALADYLP